MSPSESLVLGKAVPQVLPHYPSPLGVPSPGQRMVVAEQLGHRTGEHLVVHRP